MASNDTPISQHLSCGDKILRIGFIGNVANYPFTLAAALVRRGVDVRFVLIESEEVHRPTREAIVRFSGREGWIYDLAPLRTWDVVLPTLKQDRARRLLMECDAIVANSWGIALAATLQRPIFAIGAGSDLDLLANPAHLNDIAQEGRPTPAAWLRRKVKLWLYRRLIPLQRAGFQRAVGVEYPARGILPHGDALLDGMNIADGRRHSLMWTDVEQMPINPLPGNNPIRILGVSRVNWKEPLWPGASVLDNKRTDLLLRGVALHNQRTGRVIDLRLFRKGCHVKETEELAEQLGITHLLTWRDEVSREEFRAEVIAADIIADHFGLGTVGTAGRDALTLGRPVMAGGTMQTSETKRLPIVCATTANEIADAIGFLEDPAERQRLAAQGRSYAERYFSVDHAADIIMGLFDTTLCRPS